MEEGKADPKLWAIVMILVAVISCLGGLVGDAIGVLPDFLKPESQPTLVPTIALLDSHNEQSASKIDAALSTYTPYPTYTIFPTHTPFPTYTPFPAHTPLPTSEPVVTVASATSVPSPTPPLNTPPDTILEIGQTWKQNGAELTLSEIELCPSCNKHNLQLYWEFTNNTGNEIVLGYSFENFNAYNNLGTQLNVLPFYKDCCLSLDGYSVVLGRGESYDLSRMDDPTFGFRTFYLPITVDVTNQQVTEIIITVSGISQIENARWRIPIYH